MPTPRRVRYILNETVQDAAQLRERWRHCAADPAASRLLVRPRPQLAPGTEVTVQLSLAHGSAPVALDGRIALSFGAGPAPGLCAVTLGAAATHRLTTMLDDTPAQTGQQVRRGTTRRPLQLWGDCRRSSRDVLRTARILDVSAEGLFLASGLECRPGETVLVRPEPLDGWLAGAVRWCGSKHGEPGIGLSLTFSRGEERQRWQQWYAPTEPQAAR